MYKGFANILIIILIVVIGGAAGIYIWNQEVLLPAPIMPPTPSPNPSPGPTPSPVPIAKDCIVTGCSGQLCAGEELYSTCEYKEEYACFKSATCEPQPNGQCGWTPTKELAECLGVPLIRSISPLSGKVGSKIILTGQGFAAEKNVIKFGSGYLGYFKSTDGKTLTFTVPAELDECHPSGNPCFEGKNIPVSPDSYEVYVTNANGESNVLKFTVIGD